MGKGSLSPERRLKLEIRTRIPGPSPTEVIFKTCIIVQLRRHLYTRKLEEKE